MGPAYGLQQLLPHPHSLGETGMSKVLRTLLLWDLGTYDHPIMGPAHGLQKLLPHVPNNPPQPPTWITVQVKPENVR